MFLGHHLPSDEKVAVKLLKRFRFGHPGAEEFAIMKEVAIMKRIASSPHPNLVRFRAAYEPVIYGRKRLCIITELAEGGDLFERIAGSGRFTERAASSHFRQIMLGLKALHGMGIVHRDLKPENLLLSSKDDATARVLVTDFGLSEFKHLPMPRHCGTLAYSAPETFEKPPVYGEASDVFAAGIVLFIALSGSPPFYADHTLPKARHDALLKRQIRSGKFVFYPSLFDSVSQPVKDLIAQMLKVEPSERPTIDQVLAHPWVKGGDSVPDVHLESNIENLRRFNARRKLRAAAKLAAWSMKGGTRARELTTLVGSTSYSRDQITTLRERFAEVAGEDGRIDREEFDRALGEELGIREGSILGRMFALFDGDNNGTIEFREFICGMATLHAGGEEALKLCFDILDVDGSGALEKEELSVILRVLGNSSEAEAASGPLSAGLTIEEAKHAAAVTALTAKGIAVSGVDPHTTPAPASAASAAAASGGGAAAAGGARDEDEAEEEATPAAAAAGAAADSLSARLEYVFEKMDVNKDGRISWEEFKNGLAIEPDLVKVFLKPFEATAASVAAARA